jgi:phosphotriesterase-related protein
MISRRSFLIASVALIGLSARRKPEVITVNGPVPAGKLGTSLIHEHFLVDFIGADQIHYNRWKREQVIAKVLPFLAEVKKWGVQTIFDCTPAFLGRDVHLLKLLADRSGLHLVTNTGYYGAVKNKYLPSWAFTEHAGQLAQRWINEFNHGIEDTGIKPGFIKISVDAQLPLSTIHEKLVQAAALTHKATGLTICSHTGPAAAAFAQLEILKSEGVHPSSFVWVHAQAEKDISKMMSAAQTGAWVSLDGMGWGDFDWYVDTIAALKDAGLLSRVLISHDAGWYKPEEENGGTFQGYSPIFKEIMPRLKMRGFNNRDQQTLLVENPARAMAVAVRKW